MSDAFWQSVDETPREHPDVTLAKAHIAEREHVEALREREPEPDLRAAVAELAGLMAMLWNWTALEETNPEDLVAAINARDRARAIVERLS